MITESLTMKLIGSLTHYFLIFTKRKTLSLVSKKSDMNTHPVLRYKIVHTARRLTESEARCS